MVRLGTPAASPFVSLTETVLPKVDVYESDAAEAEAARAALDEDEAAVFWEEVKRATSRRKTYANAKANKFERELTARFGIFKGVATHPWTVRAAQLAADLSNVRWIGPPLLPAHSAVVILFMAYRGKMPLAQFLLLACFLVRVHPVLVVVGALLAIRFKSQKRLPKGYDAKQVAKRFKAPSKTLQSDADAFVDLFKSKCQSSLPPAAADECDVLFVGGRLLARLYAGALASKGGLRVGVGLMARDAKDLLLDDVGSGKGSPPSWAFRAADWRLGQFHGKYEKLMNAALLDGDTIEWDQVGSETDGFAYAIRIFKPVNGGNNNKSLSKITNYNAVVLRAGPDAFLDAAVACGARVDRPHLLHVLQQALLVANDVSAHAANSLDMASPEGEEKAEEEEDTARPKKIIQKNKTSKNTPPPSVTSWLLARFFGSSSSSNNGKTSSYQAGGTTYAAAQAYDTLAALSKLCRPATQASDAQRDDLDVERLADLGAAGISQGRSRLFGRWCFGVSHAALSGVHRPREPLCLAAALARTVASHSGVLLSPSDVISVLTKKKKKKTRVVRLPAPACTPPRTLIAFDSGAATLDVPVGVRIVADDFTLVFDRHPAGVTCVVEHTSSLASSFKPPPKTERVLDDVAALFPNTRGRHVFAHNLNAVASSRDGGDEIDDTVSRRAAADNNNNTIDDADVDFLPGPAGDVVNGWLAAHRACHYSAFDLLALQRSLLTDIPNAPPLPKATSS